MTPAISANGRQCLHFYYNNYGIDASLLEVYLLPEIWLPVGDSIFQDANHVSHHLGDFGHNWILVNVDLGFVSQKYFVSNQYKHYFFYK